MKWFLAALKKYAVFNGRARRKEYWMFTLFYIIFGIVAMVLDTVLGLNFIEGTYGVLYLLLTLSMFIPSLALSVRRLHDVGKSGGMLFIIFIPIIGAIWLFVLSLMDSQEEENEYGPNPKKDIEDSTLLYA